MVADTYAGPVDYVVFAFPADARADAGFSLLLQRVDAGTISILDLEVIGRDGDGVVRRLSAADLPVGDGDLRAVFDGAESRILDDDDVTAIAAALDDGWIAVALVYEERSLAEVASAWDQAGGHLLLSGGVEAEELDDALARTDQEGRGL